MQKKLIALAIAGMAAVPAYAQMTTGVVLYGRLDVGFDQFKATGSAADALDFKNRNRQWDNGSRIGIRGTEDLGGGMSAVFLLESGVAADTAGAGTTTSAAVNQNGSTANTAAGALGSREAWGGLQGNWGAVKFGKQNVWWTNSTINQIQANWLEVGSPFVTGGHGMLGAPSTRTNNVTHYQSPTFSGFNASVYYSPQPTATAGQGQEMATAGINPKESYWASTLRYNNGPITAQFDWGRREHVGNELPLVNGNGNHKITGYKLGGAYSYAPGSQVGLIWVRIQNDNQATAITANQTVLLGGTGLVTLANAGDNIHSDSWTLNWEHTFGNIVAIAEYGQLGSLKGGGVGTTNSDTKAKYFNIGARYNFSKRTALQTQFAQVKNDANQWVDYNGGGMGVNLPSTSSGADPRIISLGLQHNF